MTTTLKAVVCFGLATLSFGCRISEKGADEADAQAIINSGKGWPGGTVAVCFLNTPKSQGALRTVEASLRTNFEKSNVGIEFLGFKPCSELPSAPAKIWFFEADKGRAYSKYIGTTKIFSFSLPYDALGATVALPDTDNTVYLYNTSVHEFGHFAGLFHEQSRLENYNGQLCSRQEIGNFEELPRALPGSMPKQLGEFDRMSIMNYCVQGYFSQFLKLSAGDIQALRALYKPNLPTSGTVSTAINPAELCNIVVLAKPYYVDRPTAPAYTDETMSTIVGEIAVGTRLSRLITKPIQTAVGKGMENLTAIQAIPQSGALANKKIWLLGNLTAMADCRDPATLKK